MTLVDGLRRKRTTVVLLALGLALFVAGIVTVLVDRIMITRLAPPDRMLTLPVFQYEQYTDTGTTFQRIPDDSVLMLLSCATAIVGLVVVVIALVLRRRPTPTQSS